VTPIYDLTPCARCTHAAALHQVGSVCGAAGCYCREFLVTEDVSESEESAGGRPAKSFPADSDSLTFSSPTHTNADRGLDLGSSRAAVGTGG